MTSLQFLAIATTILLGAFQSANAQSRTYDSEGQKFQVETLTKQKDVIWGFDFLPNDNIIFTERSGALKIYNTKTKKVSVISGAPKVWAHQQGGLLDVRVHPTQPQKIYLTYAEPVGDGATTALGVGELKKNKLTGFKKLFSAHEASTNDIHFGSRIEFDGKGHVFITVGDRNNRPLVQDLSYHMGKVIRLREDGSVPSDNPFISQKGAKPEVWTLGHRSPQGLVIHPTTGELWMAEMGPLGGDEINLIEPGLNYGWPVITYGREYSGGKIGETSKEGMEQPIVYWAPSISPSGMAIYNGDAFPKWKGNFFLGTLGSTHIRRVVIENKKAVKQEELLQDLHWRVREVRPGKEGYLYLSTDDGRLARIVPAATIK